MARKRGPVPPTVSQILDMPNSELSRMNEKELRVLVNVLVSAGNKRIRRLEGQAAKGTIATEGLRSVQSFTQGEGWKTQYFSARDKNRNQLYAELARARRFFNDRLSEVKNAIQERKEREKRIFGETREERAARLRREEYNRKRREKRAQERAQREEQQGKSKTGKKRKAGKNGASVTSPEPEPETDETETEWEDFYNSSEYDPVEMYKKFWSGYRYFLAGFGKSLWRNARKHGFIDSETVFRMIQGYIAQGYDPREAGEKAAEIVSEMYADWSESQQDFYEES